MLRANSQLRKAIGESGYDFLLHAGEAIQRILPHVEVGKWKEGDWANGGVKWADKRTRINVTFAIGGKTDSWRRSLQASVRRRCIVGAKTKAKRTLDLREYDICRLIALRASEVIHTGDSCGSTASIQAIRDAFDEYVVAQHMQAYHKLDTPVSEMLEALHILSEQSYENKALTFGCILDPNVTATGTASGFPRDFLGSKKYKALSDGFRTAYHISNKGRIVSFVDLDRFEKKSLSEKHYYPDWAEPMAKASRSGKCGVSLSRQGDILVFDEGTLRFTYRYGRWQYWNHAHLVNILRDRARAQRVRPAILGRVVLGIYRAALDVSFRRCGGLFVILHNRKGLRSIVKVGDAIGDQKRNKADTDFDVVIQQHTIQSLPRAATVELASVDGAVVLENSGRILAYGAVLQPKKAGRLQGTEGSRTKAAIGASNYGLAVKISADGEISVYHKGEAFIRM